MYGLLLAGLYYPYGTTSYQAVDKNIKAAAKRYQYTGKERDEETGFYYHGARYYATWLGRWIACDPALTTQFENLYVYVHCNPPRFTDPNGAWGIDMHFAATYWAGRLAGASHDRALNVAIAAQAPDDFPFLNAIELKKQAAADLAIWSFLSSSSNIDISGLNLESPLLASHEKKLLARTLYMPSMLLQVGSSQKRLLPRG